MDAQKTLQNFKNRIDPEIEKYFDRIIGETKKSDTLVTDVLKYVKRLILVGGKRLRPAFMYYGYLAAGGRNLQKIVKASMSVELIHMFLLIHDDVIDSDARRHGQETVNEKYKKIAKKYFPRKNAAHFGNSIAIVAGDMIGAMGSQVIYESSFDSKLIVKALYKLQSIVSMTVIGETKDIHIEYKNKASEGEVLKMYDYKTAKYTVEGPLHLGAILSGADDRFLAELSAYAIPVGIAFQIQDDVLGIFGDEKKLGKPVGSDIMSGKQTLLVVKARELACQEDKKILDKLLGKKDLTNREIELFRRIIRSTGAYTYAKEMSEKLITEGRQAIENKKMNAEAKEFLLSVADYMVSREL